MANATQDSPAADEHAMTGVLHGLNRAARGVVDAALTLVDLRAEEIVFDAGEPLDRVWFLRSGLASLVTVLRDGRDVGGLTLGRGGVLGLPTSPGSHSAVAHAAVLVGGEAPSPA